VPDRFWILLVRLGIGGIVLGIVLSRAYGLQFGLIVISFGVFLLVAGSISLRRSRASGLAANAVEARREDFVARLDRGDTLDQVAEAYERLHKVPPASTLYYLGALIRGNVGMGGNPEVNEAAGVVLNRQAALVSSESAEAFIETFSRARNVFFLDRGVSLFPDPDQPGGGKRGTFVVSRRFVYFFANPDDLAVGAVFAQGLAKEKALDLTHIPYLGVASFGVEVVKELREGAHEDFDPKAKEEFKKLFVQPGSVAIPIRTIVSLERSRVTTRFGLPRERLVISTKDSAGPETRFCFGSEQVFDDQWFTTAGEVIRTVCVMEGRLLPR